MQEKLNSTHKIKATPEQFQEMLDYYKGYISYNNNPYVIARMKLNKTTITFYKTNVVLFQGDNEALEYKIWAEKYDLPIDEVCDTKKNDYFNISAIGSDEVGTGDYFGPITVCASLVTKDKIQTLQQLGVKDSKLLTDKQVIEIGVKISEIIPYSIIFLEPAKLNHLKPEHQNFNLLKAILHNKAINNLLKKIGNTPYDAIIMDQFASEENYFKYLEGRSDVITNITMVPKGESENIAVAASSILARVAFLKELKRLSTEYKIELLKGAGPEVDKTAISFIRAHGYNEFTNVAKLKFANTERVKEYFKTNPISKLKQGNMFNEK